VITNARFTIRAVTGTARSAAERNGAKRTSWLESTSDLLLEGIDYYQVVFTIPQELSSLTLGNRRVMFRLLFQSAWKALKQVIEDEQQFEAAAGMVLYTWNQKLDAHIHVHAFVPGGGPSLADPGTWKTARPPAYETQNRFWLVDADELRAAFRTAFLKGLRRLHAKEELNLAGEWSHLRDPSAFETWVQPLESVTWVTYIQAPPTKETTPDHVLKYLARYLTGGPISDRRLVRHEDGQVTFTARTGTQTGGSRETEQVSVSGVEFVRRWSLHILPKGLTKTRCYGGYSNHHRKRYLEECGRLLSIGDTAADNPSTETPDEDRSDHLCPKCESIMTCVGGTDRPGWKVVMSSVDRPEWYDDG